MNEDEMTIVRDVTRVANEEMKCGSEESGKQTLQLEVYSRSNHTTTTDNQVEYHAIDIYNTLDR